MLKVKPQWTQTAVLRYGMAFLSVSIAALFLATYGRGAYVSVLLCAVMFSAWFGGVKPGLVATALSLVAFKYGLDHFTIRGPPGDTERMIVFATVAFFVVAVIGSLKRTQEKLRVSEARYRALHQDNPNDDLHPRRSGHRPFGK